MSIFFTSDLHLGHFNIIRHCDRPFSSVSEMDNAIIANINKFVKPNDELYILGDFSFYGSEEQVRRYRNRINAKRVYMIKGNHDKNFSDRNIFSQFQMYKELKYKKQHLVLFHYPIREWNRKYHGSIQLHGHSHNKPEYNFENKHAGCLQYDVGIDANLFRPVKIEHILHFFDKK